MAAWNHDPEGVARECHEEALQGSPLTVVKDREPR